MHGHKLLLTKPHVGQGKNFINLKSHESAHVCTIINIYVFKSANIAVSGLFLHPPDRKLE